MSSIHGVGELRWGYQLAAELDFTITQDPGPARSLVVRGRVTKADPFVLRQRPLVFVWPLAARRWQYTLASVEITDDHVTARIGSRQD